jgi:hypothetical protein
MARKAKPRKNLVPRNSKPKRFTADVRAKILATVRIGNYRETACRRARISDRTLRDWVERGAKELDEIESLMGRKEAGEDVTIPELSEFAQFALDLEDAEAKCEQACVGVVLDGDTEDVRWFMERRWPRRWGKLATRVELSGPDGGPIEVEDARRQLLERLTAQLDRTSDGGGTPSGDPLAPE